MPRASALPAGEDHSARDNDLAGLNPSEQQQQWRQQPVVPSPVPPSQASPTDAPANRLSLRPPLPRIVLTKSASHMLLLLHNGETEGCLPLGDEQHEHLVQELQTAASSALGTPLPSSLALCALEAARHVPLVNGRSLVEVALSCLEFSPAKQPTDTTHQVLNPARSSLLPPLSPLSHFEPLLPSRVTANSSAPVAPAPSIGANSFIRTVSSRLPLLSESANFRRFSAPPESRHHPARVHVCTSCGSRGHTALSCPHGIDVAVAVDAARELGRNCRARVLELSSAVPNEGPEHLAAIAECNHAVREEAVSSIAELSGISEGDVSRQLDADQGDPEQTFLSAMCYVQGGENSHALDLACRNELGRRRRFDHCNQANRTAASSSSREAAFRSLSSGINLPAQLGYGYRATSDVDLPPLPERPINLRKRRKEKDDLDFIVSDHSSESGVSSLHSRKSSPPPRRRRSGSSSRRSTNTDDDDEDSDDDNTDERSQSGDSCSDKSCPTSGDDGDSADKSRSSSPSSSESGDVVRDDETPLTAASLAKLFKRLLKNKTSRSDNNGLLASKTPSFWDLGEAPVGGYFAQTFSKVYGEYRQFVNVFGRKTGVTFKKLIMPDMIPMIRDDLKLTRKGWNSIRDEALLKRIKLRLGFKERDGYIAELEACPRLTADLRDPQKLNDRFKKMSAQMLAICERARKHGVKLLTSSCKHVFGEAVRDCYRINQWFHLERFKSIGASVRHINSKLHIRLANAAEQKHERAMDEARFHGVRSQVGAGTSEGSNAPDRKRKSPGGIAKPSKEMDKQSRDKLALKLDGFYKIENALPKGRYWHARTPFCTSDECTMKFCQGCGKHQVVGQPWHDRPKCNCRKHPDFVAAGYFHDKWPGRLSIHAKPPHQPNDSNSSRPAPPKTATPVFPRPSFGARSNSVHDDKNSPDGASFDLSNQ